MSLDYFYRDSWVEVQLDAIKFNIEQLKQQLQQHTGIYAVVKANAYGHGDIQVAKAALEAGAQGLAVSLLDEALKLRQEGIKETPILVMGYVRPEDVPLAVKNNLILTMFQSEWLARVKEQTFTGNLSLHMKWDTGMGRVGVRTVEEMEAILNAFDDPRLKLEGIFTHFATADEEDRSYFNEQQQRFDQMLTAFQNLWKQPVQIHTGNSAASMRFPEQMKHMVRFGIGMYGLYPSPVVKDMEPISLLPSFSLHSQLIHVKNLPKGEYISYGATYQTTANEWIGTIPIGYGDGWLRKLQGMEVLVDGKRMPIVGRICMDQFMIRLDQPYSIGTKVTLIGKQLQSEISIDEIAAHLETINYEIPCLISYRVPRMYYKNYKLLGIDNPLL